MRRSLAALLALALCLPAAAAPWRRNRTEYFPYRRITLENPFLTVVFAPGQLGRIASVKLRKSGTELLDEFKLCRYTETPLFHLDKGNFQGIRELLWRRSLSGVSPMEPVSGKEGEILFETRTYGGSTLGLRRRARLLPDAPVLEFETVLTNNGRADENISLWYNLQGAPPARPLIPAAGQGKVPGRGEVELHDRAFLFTGAPGNSHLPPAAPWAAFSLSGRRILWAMECPEISGGGFFYSWGSPAGTLPVRRTAEFVLAPVTLAPGAASPVVRCRVMVFPGLEGINALCAGNAFEIAKRSSGEHALTLCTSVSRPAEKLLCELRSREGKILYRREFDLPPRRAGECRTLDTVKLAAPPVSGTLRLGGNETGIFFEKE